MDSLVALGLAWGVALGVQRVRFLDQGFPKGLVESGLGFRVSIVGMTIWVWVSIPPDIDTKDPFGL